MGNCIRVGCDWHDATMRLKVGVGRGAPEKLEYGNAKSGRQAMIEELKTRAKSLGGAKVYFAYEASALGFGLYDELTEAKMICYVLAPSRIERSPHQRRRKTDEKDAERLLDIVRGHVLAGNPMPAVWVPDAQTRDDREVVRARIDAVEKRTAIKAQVRTLLKRQGTASSFKGTRGRTKGYWAWLRYLAGSDQGLSAGARVHLKSLLRQAEALDQEVAALAETERYAEAVREMMQIRGVGVLTARVFLTERGDLSRFRNRKQIGASLGLVPSSHQSGEQDDRKGHITGQGSPRVRMILNQATWIWIRYDLEAKALYERIAAKNPKHKKIALAAMMRRLAVRLWHAGQEAQRRAGLFQRRPTEAAA